MNRLLSIFALLSSLSLVFAVDFSPPTAKERMVAIGETESLPPLLKRALETNDFTPIVPPGPTDWLFSHEEPGQTYDQFIDSKRKKPDATRNKVYFLPLGEFPKDKSPSLKELQDYAAAFFQMKVEVLPALTKYSFTTRKISTGRQIYTLDVLDFLIRKLPKDGFCILAITMEDLYPDEKWNFVFGQASLVRRVGVFSFARYDPAFLGLKRVGNYAQVLLKRSCKVLAHETGHMFGIQHCIYFQCLMNGSNNMQETDRSPLHLCPVCLRKLQSSTGFDVQKHYRDQYAFFQKVDFTDEVVWLQKRIEKIEK